MDTNFIVRQAVVTDAENIYYINKTSLGYDYDLDKQKAKLEMILNDSTQAVFVAAVGNRAVGYIHLANYDVIYADNYKNCLGLAVDNDFKRMGIGSALLKQAENWAKENGASGIRLCSGIERENAHKFYKSQGYTENKTQKNLRKIFK
ncbi:MAG: GNAT family N-acetyltransferase [Clostridia bacterium]|nr:GNAT family N-acetyltransferase [Clostridia bacterium]